MRVTAEFVKSESLVAKLQSLARRVTGQAKLTVLVGYTAPYAVHVHEDLHMRHTVGQAKFLEEPARRLGPELGRIIHQELRDGRTLGQALLKAGLMLQRESQKLTPVDTGLLVRSAFTRLERY